MNLKKKLFFTIGLILLCTAIAMYFFPAYLIKGDIYNVENRIRELIINDHLELIQNQTDWVNDEIKSLQEDIHAILLTIQGGGGNEALDANPWIAAAEIAKYDPKIGLIQIHSLENKVSAVLTPAESVLHPIKSVINRKGMTWIILEHSDTENLENYMYIGIPISNKLQFKLDEIYVLVNWTDQIPTAREEIEAVRGRLTQESIIDSNRYEDEKEAIKEWADKTDLLQLLAPLFAEGFRLDKSGKEIIPAGIARIQAETGRGNVLLSKDLFGLRVVFDDEKYYKAHLPEKDAPPIANGFILVRDEQGNSYLTNTILLNSTYISVGVSLDQLVQKLAIASNQSVLLEQQGDFLIGYDRSGQRLHLDSSILKKMFQSEHGELEINGSSYYYNAIRPLKNLDVTFYTMHSLDRLDNISRILGSLEKNLSERIAWQVFLLSFGGMALVLFLVARTSLRVIDQLGKLAKAAEAVGNGKYGEIALPDVTHQKDEIATLTTSFSSMVKGLQERETIRGVLNKVVSKDIADEILRSKIHLGGEDRIVTILFSDIRDFTKITENLPPQKIIEMLNLCMTKMSRVIETEGGLIDKFVGDEIMALYGAPSSHPDHALRAVSSALLMVETLKKWNQERNLEGLPPIEMGIGIHTGLVVAGNMGAEDRLNYTVLGANVNLAARLCSIAGRNEVIISEGTLREPNIESSFFVKPLEPILPKGFSEPVKIYQVMGFKWDEV